MSQASALEQYMLELINTERAAAGAQPLAFNGDLNESSEDHSAWMLATNTFSHTGQGGSSAGDRMAAAGYAFTGSWTWGENIAWQSTRGAPGLQDDVANLHQGLMNSSGHRANILNGAFREIGIGVEQGNFSGWDAAMATQNFAKSGNAHFLTGVAYDDKDNDNRYDVGEGLGGIQVVIVDSNGNQVQTSTGGAGGYQIALANGTYTVTFSGTGLESQTEQVTIAGGNVKRDYADPDPGNGGGGGDSENGTSGNDTLIGDSDADILNGLGGNDILKGHGGGDILDGGSGDDTVDGGNGDDRLIGGGGNDRLIGASNSGDRGVDVIDAGAGNDRIYADAGDTVLGGTGTDTLIVLGPDRINANLASMSVEVAYGSAGDDNLYGGGVSAASLHLRGRDGDDVLTGGSRADRLYGGDDDDILRGRDGNDYLRGEDGRDILEGGGGNDRLRGDAGADTLTGGDGRDVMTGGGGADLFANGGSDGFYDRVTDYRASQGDAIVDGASYVFSGRNTYVYDSGGTLIMRLDRYDADSDGITYA